MVIATRRKHDTDFVTDMCQKHLNTTVSITKCFHLGKKGSKPRLLKISLSTEIEKAKLLRNCTKLRDPNLPLVMRKIFITPDLTPNEQRFNNELRTRLKEMNKDEHRYQIKNGRIVERKK